jgi:pyridinium-3,5-bisthiocarboxylic acid mononucleotide nickel chelatase
MKTAWLDCSSGISGDMCLGALVDTGASLSSIRKQLQKIHLHGYTLSSKKVIRNGITATKVDVNLPKASHANHAHHEHARKWKDVRKLIEGSDLDSAIKKKGLTIFRSIFEAEANVHGASVDTVHLHELGAVDCMVDILGTIIGLDLLGIEKVFASPVNTGEGSVKTAHGILPVPAPATASLLTGVPVYSSGIPFELTTPTGAAILKGIVTTFGPMPPLCLASIGYGAGSREIEGMPNALRMLVGEDFVVSASGQTGDSVIVLETNIDDMNPQYYEGVMNSLFNAGALDVFLENIIMKKGRPAIKLTALVRAEDSDLISDILFAETTTIGIRIYRAERKVLDRKIVKVKTRYGVVRFKISMHQGKVVTATPEYDDLKAIAEKNSLPIKKIAAELAGLSNHTIMQL